MAGADVVYDILFKNKASQPTNSEQEHTSRKGAILDLKWNPEIHEIEEEEEEEEEKYEPQPEAKLQAWENLLRSQARPVPKCQEDLQVVSCQKVLKALEDFKQANGGQDALALMDQEWNELNNLNKKNTEEEENEVKDTDEKNTQEEKNEVKDTDEKNTQEEKNEVKDTKNTKDTDEKNTQEEKKEVKAEVKDTEDQKAPKKNKLQMDKKEDENVRKNDDPETSQPRKKAKKTFANRAPPKTEVSYIQWAAMKNAYEKGNAPIPTVNEGKFYNYCREKWGGNLPEPTVHENPDLFQRYCQAKSEAEGAEVTIELRAEVYKSSALALYQQWMAERIEAALLLD